MGFPVPHCWLLPSPGCSAGSRSPSCSFNPLLCAWKALGLLGKVLSSLSTGNFPCPACGVSSSQEVPLNAALQLPRVLHPWLVHRGEEADVSILQREGGPQEDVQQPVSFLCAAAAGLTAWAQLPALHALILELWSSRRSQEAQNPEMGWVGRGRTSHPLPAPAVC